MADGETQQCGGDMNKTTWKALKIDEIYQLVKPFSELGIKEKRDFKLFSSETIEESISYYGHLSYLFKVINNNPELINSLGSTLSHFEDIHSLLEFTEDHVLDMHELYSIKHFIYFYRIVINHLNKLNIEIVGNRDFTTLFDILDIDKQNSPAFYISNQYSETFSKLKEELFSLQSMSANILGNISKKAVSELGLNKFEEKVTVSKLNQELLNKLIESGYFYITDENFANITLRFKKTKDLLELDDKINNINNLLDIETENIRKMLSNEIFKEKDNLKKAINDIAFLDLLLAKIIFARKYDCSIPVLAAPPVTAEGAGAGTLIKVKNSFNIILKEEINRSEMLYQKIDLAIDKKINIFTGSNMGGKTTILTTVGQIAILTKLGMPVPAENVQTQLFDNVIFCGPLSKEDRADLSSFGNEIITLQNVIETKGKNLFLLDEFGRGTNATEGQKLFHSTIKYFSENTDTTVLSATHFIAPQKIKNLSHFQLIGLKDEFISILKSAHYDNLNDKLKLINKYMNYQPIEVSEDTIIPNSAILVAELLGLEKSILKDI